MSKKRSKKVQVKVSSVLTGYQIPIIKDKTKPQPLLGQLTNHVGNENSK